MDTDSEAAPEPVVLIIADISGYTRYMTANAKTLAHSQTIITELVKTIVRQVDLPLEVAKLEGDAVFLFGRKLAGPDGWAARKKALGEKLLTFFETFREKVRELSRSTTCACHACTHIEKLRLKVIVHSGEALFHRVLNFQELAGVDVIIVHRLLKNSVAADQYLLITEAAQKDVELPQQAHLAAGVETHEGIGRINIGVYYPEGLPAAVGASHLHRPVGPRLEMVVETADRRSAERHYGGRFVRAWKWSLKLWFKPVLGLVAGDQAEFHHLDPGGSQAGRFAFALLTLILTPIYLPVSTIFTAFHALKTAGPEPPIERNPR